MNEANGSHEAAAPEWFAALERFCNETGPRLETALGTLLEHEAHLKPEAPSLYTTGQIESLFPDGPVLATVKFSGATIGNWRFLFPRSLAAMLADLTMMGKGNTPFDEAIHPDALGEIWGQVIAALEEYLNSITAAEITIEMPEVSLDPTPFLTDLRSFPVVKWDISIRDIGSGFILHQFSPELEPFLTARADSAAPAAQDSGMEELRGERSEDAIPESPLVRTARFEDFAEDHGIETEGGSRNMDMLLDINLPITIELGRTTMLIRDVLELGAGSVIELDKLSGEPVDLYVNDRKFARGEVVVIEENFGVRITELVKIDERLKGLQ